MRNNDDEDPIIAKYGRISPEALLREVGEKRIMERLVFLEKAYNLFHDKWPGVYMNPYLMREAVESYFCDIYRLKFFRPVERINAYKQAAYTMKWLARIRPIQMCDGTGPDLSTIMVNGYFALMAGLALLDIDVDPHSDKWWAGYITETTYLLHYHSASIESLCSEMGVLKALDDAKNKG